MITHLLLVTLIPRSEVSASAHRGEPVYTHDGPHATGTQYGYVDGVVLDGLPSRLFFIVDDRGHADEVTEAEYNSAA